MLYPDLEPFTVSNFPYGFEKIKSGNSWREQTSESRDWFPIRSDNFWSGNSLLAVKDITHKYIVVERNKKIEYEKQKMIPNVLNLRFLSKSIDNSVPLEKVLVKDVLSTSEAGIERYYVLELDSVNLLDLIFDK